MADSVFRSGLARLPPDGVFANPMRNLAALLAKNGYSQDQELEADDVGLRLMRAAGYDTKACLRLLSRFRTSVAGESNLSTYLSSHPRLEGRLEHLKRVQRGV